MEGKSQSKPQKGLVQLILGALGIYVSYILLGICSERLYSSHYESSVELTSDGSPVSHKFTHPSMLVWLSGLCCAVLGLIKGWFNKEGSSPMPMKQIIILGTLFAINMNASNFALLHVSYPTHALCSNSRYLIIVFIGTYLSRVPHKDDLKLPKHKLYVALFITTGVVLFNLVKLLSGDNASNNEKEDQWKGFGLIFVSMLAEAMFCDSQAYCKAAYKPSANHFFKSANFCSFLFSITGSLITGTLFPGIQFVLQHPQCLKEIALLCALQVTGQLSIYFIVTNFKQHIFPLISATRKIITVVCSIMIFNHSLSALQWVCVSVVFGGMIVEVREEILEKRKQEKQKDKINPEPNYYQKASEEKVE